ncbi:MAG: helix-hairpin-helix domain-containing protein [Gemmatimonadetes bacterium]|nr:helix-hairpin-helix domain-containing protein [Gemmatimonadota bacterium]
MPTPAERKALVFLAALAALGAAARGFFERNAATAADARSVAALERQIQAVDAAKSASQRPRAPAASRPKRAPQRAPKSAAAVPQRENSAESRLRVSAGGSARTTPSLELYEARRLAVERANSDARARVSERAAELARQRGPPPKPPAAGATVRTPERGPAPTASTASTLAWVPDTTLVDLDTAGADAIATLPGLGAVLAARIVEDRRLRGPFGSLAELQRVRGIGRSLAGRIATHVTFSRP